MSTEDPRHPSPGSERNNPVQVNPNLLLDALIVRYHLKK